LKHFRWTLSLKKFKKEFSSRVITLQIIVFIGRVPIYTVSTEKKSIVCATNR